MNHITLQVGKHENNNYPIVIVTSIHQKRAIKFLRPYTSYRQRKG